MLLITKSALPLGNVAKPFLRLRRSTNLVEKKQKTKKKAKNFRKKTIVLAFFFKNGLQ